MSNQLIQVLKEISKETMDASRPVRLMFGKVVKEEPLEILVEQKKLLTRDFLILTRNVTEHNIEMTVDHITEDADDPQTGKMAGGGGDPSFISHLHIHHHKHPYKGRKVWLVHKRLKLNEIVAILQMQGGQKYLVLDRVEGGAYL